MAKKKKRTKRRKKKKISFKLKFIALALIIIGIAVFFAKDISISYYTRIESKALQGAALKSAVHDMIRKHEYLNFEQNTTARYWWNNYFKKTDWNPNGHFWDMYSTEKHAEYINGNLQSREHCMPRSWWGQRDKYPSYDANGDLHNIFPSDYSANAAKSNLPLGEVGIAIFDNGLSKVGNNTYPRGYRGRVFEPADEYKGDFARIFFYMVTCYEDYAYSWRTDALKSMLQKGAYPSFQPWAIDMLLKWHRKDPVSEKERKRNEEVYKIQRNRNPFVDYPELAEHIWGNKKDEPFEPLKDKTSQYEPQLKDRINFFLYKLKDIYERIPVQLF